MATAIVNPQTPSEQHPVTALVDHLAVTLPIGRMEEVTAILGKSDWTQLPYGRRGYTHGMTREGMQIHYAGDATRNKAGEETLHLILHGSGCRLLEGQGVIDPSGPNAAFPSWETLLAHLLTLGASVRRLDIALDTPADDILPKMVEAIEGTNLTTRFQEFKGYTEYKRGVEGSAVEGIAFGDRRSQAYIRAYDKAAEQRKKGKPYEGSCTRVEVEFKGNKAHSVACTIAAQGSIGFVAGIIKGLLDFKEPSANKQRTRWKTAPWWEAFLGSCSKVRLAVSPIIRTIKQVEAWVERQVAPSLALLFASYLGDWEKLERMIDRGRHRWKQRHKDLLASVQTPPEGNGSEEAKESSAGAFLPTFYSGSFCPKPVASLQR